MFVRVPTSLFLMWLFCNVIYCDDECTTYKSEYFSYPKSEEINDIKQICAENLCLTKCCKVGEVHYNAQNTDHLQSGCRNVNDIIGISGDKLKDQKFDYSELTKHFYKFKGENLEKDNLSIDNFTVYYDTKFEVFIQNCTSRLPIFGRPLFFFAYLTKDGKMYRERPNRYERFQMVSNDFCFEYLVEYSNEDENKDVSVKIHFLRYNVFGKTNLDREITFARCKIAALIASNICLVLMLFVYGSLPELWKVGTRMQMAYCATFLMRDFTEVINYYSFNMRNCMYPTIVLMYFILSSNFWMNAATVNMWRAFGRAGRKFHGSGRPLRPTLLGKGWERRQLIWYSVYAWTVPLLLMIAIYVIDQVDLTAYPYIMKPFLADCFSKGGIEMNYYYNIPVGIIQIANILMFIIIAVHIWRGNNNIDIKDKSSISKKHSSFSLLCKLTLYTGISWMLDIIVGLPDWLAKTGVIINSLTGVFIFFIFCFHRKKFVQLCVRYKLTDRYEFARKAERKWSVSVSTATTAQSSRKKSETGSEISKAEISEHP